MFMPERASLIALVAAFATAAAFAQESPGLGMPISAADLAAWDISIEPDGTGLPPGSGTARQGSGIYTAKCLACHGQDGSGQPNDRLAGGHGTLQDADPVKTVGSYWPYATTIFDYIRRAMPFTEPQSLRADEVYALTAYLLQLNGIIGMDDVMDAATLPQVEMPNRGNFLMAYPALPE